LPGSEGGGIADVIFKAANGSVPYDFHGKLSFSWPRTPQQTGVPVRADDPPLFPYGYGLRYHDDGDLKTLPEDAGTTAPAAIDTHVFFAAGRPGAGWAWFAGAGVAMSGTDKSAQEDARQVSWQGPSAAVGLSGSTPIDLQREANGQLSLAFDYRINAPVATNITLAIECGPNCRASIPIAHALTSTTTPGQWGHIKVPLVCFARSGADMTRITTPFALQATGPLTLGLANIRLESGLDGELACGAR
jgi:beta-glucosidase